MVEPRDELRERGFACLPREAAVLHWAEAARPAALRVTADPAMRARWLRHGETWFVGVDALPNAPDGAVGGVPLEGSWREIVQAEGLWSGALHPAQLSVVYPGYPRRDAEESPAAHRFRRDRDAAHLDGLLPEGPARRRHLREHHAFLLGLPLTEVTEATAPFVIWEGSHHLVRAALIRRLGGIAPALWGAEDLTEDYAALRREVFETCPRRILTAGPGEAILAHRLSIHGVAPWGEGDGEDEVGRMIAWFRPETANLRGWLLGDDKAG